MPDIKSTLFYPMLVSQQGTVDSMSSQERVSLWQQYLKLPKQRQDVLTDEQLSEKLVDLQKQYNLSDKILGNVSLCIRKIYFEELSLIEAEKEISVVLLEEGQSVEIAKKIVLYIQQEIMTIVPQSQIQSSEEKSGTQSSIKLVRLPLLKALAEYPRLNEQLITAEKIRIKSQPEPARPNLANWIRYYRDELGIGFHDQVTRGKFLFQSENGKKLSADERERIHLVLKSLEEEFPLEINGEQGTIVFPVRTQPSPVSSAFPKQSGLNAPARLVKPFTPNIPAPVAPSPPVSTPRATQKVAAPTEKTSFFSGAFGAGKNVADDTLHFSTGHVLPSEKQTVQPGSVPKQGVSPASSSTFGMTGISQNRGGALPRSPYSIRPLRMREDTNYETEVR